MILYKSRLTRGIKNITFDDADLVILELDHVGILHGGVQGLRPVVLVRLRRPALIPSAVPEAAVAPEAGVRIRLVLVVVRAPEAQKLILNKVPTLEL